MRRTKKPFSLSFFIWTAIGLFILFYPMLISIYVFLPLLIGLMGYILILGVDKERSDYILPALIYFINLEINLSLPFFLTVITVLIVYIVFYQALIHIRGCSLCAPVITVILIDFVYLGSLLAYDFLFQETTIVLDSILLYSLIIDLLAVVTL